MEPLQKYLRFNFDADTLEAANEYIINRSKQLLRLDYYLEETKDHEWGVEAFFSKGDKTYQAIYILKSARGKGIYKQQVTNTILTSVECGLADYLTVHNIDYVLESLTPFKEYELISDYYGSDKAKRSGVDYMNHIDEGLAILEWIGASELAKKAYCLHPIYQSDIDLAANYSMHNIDSEVMLRVMEYRSVANEYLSTRKIINRDEIRLSPLKDVNDMLIADKIQNYKDFEMHHANTHPRTAELEQYFINWLARLGLTSIEYKEYKLRLL